MIHCDGLTKTFHLADHPALTWSLDQLSIARGERVLISGPSGCGKTTLLQLIAGIIRPDAGRLRVHDIRLDALSLAELDLFRGQHLGLIFQSFHLLSTLTVLQNVLLGARFGRKWPPAEARARATRMLDAVGLAPRAGMCPARLSIGEQQRVAIARALINEPPVVLADEPTASLDPRRAAEVLDLLCALCDTRGATLVVVSHDPRVADRFARQIDAAPWIRTMEVAHV